MSDQLVIALRSTCKTQFQVSRAAFFCLSSVLAWPGILLLTGNRPPESLCSFILLCLGWLTFQPCLCCGHLPRDSFPALWPVPEQEHSQALPHCLDQMRRQVYCGHPFLELQGSRASQLLFSPRSPQFINLQSSFILRTCYHALLVTFVANTLGQPTVHFQ